MTNNGIKSMLTISDQNGFCIKDLSNKDVKTNNKLNKEKGKQILYITIPCAVLCWLATILIKMLDVTSKYTSTYIVSSIVSIILVIISTIIYFMYISSDNSIMKYTYYIEVTVVNKLDIEEYNIPNSNGTSEVNTFYPILGKDTTTNYESICYVNKSIYDSCSIDDIISINLSENNL